MPLPSRHPREGDRRGIQFGYATATAKATWNAYIAGAMWGGECHTAGKCKACVRILTSGKLRCPMCERGESTEWEGYLPLYREMDGRPVFVILQRAAGEVAEPLRFRSRVIVGRDGGVGGLMFVRPHPNHEWYTSTLPERRTPSDITLSLLTVWQLPELTAWYNGGGAVPEKSRERQEAELVEPPSGDPIGTEELNGIYANADPALLALNARLLAARAAATKDVPLIGQSLNGKLPNGRK